MSEKGVVTAILATVTRGTVAAGYFESGPGDLVVCCEFVPVPHAERSGRWVLDAIRRHCALADVVDVALCGDERDATDAVQSALERESGARVWRFRDNLPSLLELEPDEGADDLRIATCCATLSLDEPRPWIVLGASAEAISIDVVRPPGAGRGWRFERGRVLSKLAPFESALVAEIEARADALGDRARILLSGSLGRAQLEGEVAATLRRHAAWDSYWESNCGLFGALRAHLGR